MIKSTCFLDTRYRSTVQYPGPDIKHASINYKGYKQIECVTHG